MIVRIKLYGTYGRYRPEGAPKIGFFDLEVPDDATAGDVANRLGIPPSWVREIYINDNPGARTQELVPGDEVIFLSPTGGGRK